MTLRVLSLGAGVQSTTLALMAADGEIGPMPDCAIFADTQWEPATVYKHLDRLEKLLPFPVHRVTMGDIRDTIGTGGYESIPWYTNSGAMGRRQCTYQFKLRPIRQKVRNLLGEGMPRAGACEMWLGISRDEAHRMKPATVAYIINRWPLIERDMTRADCRRWLERHSISAPRSACCGCPFMSNEDWRHKRSQPEWNDTVALSDKLAALGQFMHRSLKPIDQADFGDEDTIDMFGNECEGMCGV